MLKSILQNNLASLADREDKSTYHHGRNPRVSIPTLGFVFLSQNSVYGSVKKYMKEVFQCITYLIKMRLDLGGKWRSDNEKYDYQGV